MLTSSVGPSSSQICTVSCATREVTAVVGPSGSGKSSLVLAGLVPVLRANGALVVAMTPGDDPFSSISRALTEIGTTANAAALEVANLRAPGGLARAATALSQSAALTVIIDQLEELWTNTDPDERTAFLGAVAAMAHGLRRRQGDRHRAGRLVRPAAQRTGVRAAGRAVDLRCHSDERRRVARGDQRARRTGRRPLRGGPGRTTRGRGTRPARISAAAAIRACRPVRSARRRNDRDARVRGDGRPRGFGRSSRRHAVRQLPRRRAGIHTADVRTARHARRGWRGHPASRPARSTLGCRRTGGAVVRRLTVADRRSRSRHTRADGRDRPRSTAAVVAAPAPVARRRPRLGG